MKCSLCGLEMGEQTAHMCQSIPAFARADPTEGISMDNAEPELLALILYELRAIRQQREPGGADRAVEQWPVRVLDKIRAMCATPITELTEEGVQRVVAERDYAKEELERVKRVRDFIAGEAQKHESEVRVLRERMEGLRSDLSYFIRVKEDGSIDVWVPSKQTYVCWTADKSGIPTIRALLSGAPPKPEEPSTGPAPELRDVKFWKMIGEAAQKRAEAAEGTVERIRESHRGCRPDCFFGNQVKKILDSAPPAAPKDPN